MDNEVKKEKLCIVCAKPMPMAGTKCTECDSFQNWRRHLHFSSNILALLVALISVISLSIPILKDAFTTDNSKLSIQFQSFNKHGAVFMVSNTGKKAGGIESAFLLLPFEYASNIYLKSLSKSPDAKISDEKYARKFISGRHDILNIAIGANNSSAYAYKLAIYRFNKGVMLPVEPFFQEGGSGQLTVRYDDDGFIVKDINNSKKDVLKRLDFSKKRRILEFGDFISRNEMLHLSGDTLKDINSCKIEFHVINFDGSKGIVGRNINCHIARNKVLLLSDVR